MRNACYFLACFLWLYCYRRNNWVRLFTIQIPQNVFIWYVNEKFWKRFKSDEIMRKVVIISCIYAWIILMNSFILFWQMLSAFEFCKNCITILTYYVVLCCVALLSSTSYSMVEGYEFVIAWMHSFIGFLLLLFHFRLN